MSLQMRLKLKDILIKGSSIRAVKIKDTKEVRDLIDRTIAEQKAILELKEQPFINHIITI